MGYFILGFIFAIVIVPLMDGVTNLTLTAFETVKSAMAVTINDNNKKMEEETGGGCAIGFAIPNEEDFDDDDI